MRTFQFATPGRFLLVSFLFVLTVCFYCPGTALADGGGGLPTNTPEPTQTPTVLPTATQTTEPTTESQSTMKGFNATLEAMQPTATIQPVGSENQSANWINYLLYAVILVGMVIVGLIAYIVIRQRRG